MPFNEYNGQLALINLFLWFILWYKYRSVIFTNPIKKVNSNYVYAFIVTSLYCVFAFAEADTYHLEPLYEISYKTDERFHLEPFYIWSIQVLPHNYYFWRFAIWGTSIYILLYRLSYKLRLDNNLICLVLPISLLPYLSQTRGTLGFVLLLLSIVLLVGSGWYKKMLGACFLLGSLYLHKSIPIFALMIPIAYFFPFKKKTILISLIVYPFLYKSVGYISSEILSFSFLNETTTESGNAYLERDNVDFTAIGLLFNIVQWVTIGLALFVTSKYFTISTKNIDNRILIIHKYAYVMFYVAFLFYGQSLSGFLYSRTLHFAYFPLFISLTYYLQRTHRRKIDSILIVLLLLFSFKEIAYQVYKYW